MYMNICTYIHIYTQNEILFSHEKEGNPAIFDNMDKRRGHYTKWEKSERQMYDFTTCGI